MAYQTPYLSLKTAPAAEPVTLAEAKLQLRVDGSSEDSYITLLITAARRAAEEFMRRSLITQTWELKYDDSAPEKVRLLRGPVQSVTSVKSITRAGVETTLSSSGYYLNAGKEELIFDSGPIGDFITIEYVAGYGNAAAIPESIKQGMLSHVAAMFENRVEPGAMPQGAVALYAPYRVVAL